MPRSPSEQLGKRKAPSASARKTASARGLTGLKGRAYVGATIARAKEEKRKAKAEGARKGMGRPSAKETTRARKPKKTTAEDEAVKRAREQLAEARTAKANRTKAARSEKLANTPERKVQQLEASRAQLLSDKRAIHEALREMNAHVRRGNAEEIQARIREKGALNDRLTAIDAQLARLDKKLVEIRHARASRRNSPEVDAAALRAAAEEKARTRGRRA